MRCRRVNAHLKSESRRVAACHLTASIPVLDTPALARFFCRFDVVSLDEILMAGIAVGQMDLRQSPFLF
jgi:hypothetical protein